MNYTIHPLLKESTFLQKSAKHIETSYVASLAQSYTMNCFHRCGLTAFAIACVNFSVNYNGPLSSYRTFSVGIAITWWEVSFMCSRMIIILPATEWKLHIPSFITYIQTESVVVYDPYITQVDCSLKLYCFFVFDFFRDVETPTYQFFHGRGKSSRRSLPAESQVTIQAQGLSP